MDAPRMVADYACVVGENPLWHATEQCLYWTDIDTGRLFRLDPATGQHECFYQGEKTGGFTFQRAGGLLLFQARGAIRLWRDGSLTTLIDEIAAERYTRFNDVIADPAGRVFCGTMPSGQEPGRLYRLDTDGTIRVVLDGIGCSNGMGFSPDRKVFYYTDTHARAIYSFDYDSATGEISGQQVFARVPTGAGEGGPDGMTVDASGRVWSARWGGGRVVRYTPGGDVDAEVAVPAPKVSSLAFGGADLRDMYITTAGGDRRAEDGPGAGALYVWRANEPGQPELYSDVRMPSAHGGGANGGCH